MSPVTSPTVDRMASGPHQRGSFRLKKGALGPIEPVSPPLREDGKGDPVSKDTGFKHRGADALVKLQAMIAEVDKRCPAKCEIVPSFLRMEGREDFDSGWFYSTVTFMCAVQYKIRDVDSQVTALRKVGALAEYISNEADAAWGLPTGISVTRKWIAGSKGEQHLQVTEDNALDPNRRPSQPGKEGGFTFDAKVLNYTPETRPQIGLLVSYRYKNWRKD